MFLVAFVMHMLNAGLLRGEGRRETEDGERSRTLADVEVWYLRQSAKVVGGLRLPWTSRTNGRRAPAPDTWQRENFGLDSLKPVQPISPQKKTLKSNGYTAPPATWQNWQISRFWHHQLQTHLYTAR
jgi:hypothetical protein